MTSPTIKIEPVAEITAYMTVRIHPEAGSRVGAQLYDAPVNEMVGLLAETSAYCKAFVQAMAEAGADFSNGRTAYLGSRVDALLLSLKERT